MKRRWQLNEKRLRYWLGLPAFSRMAIRRAFRVISFHRGKVLSAVMAQSAFHGSKSLCFKYLYNSYKPQSSGTLYTLFLLFPDPCKTTKKKLMLISCIGHVDYLAGLSIQKSCLGFRIVESCTPDSKCVKI